MVKALLLCITVGLIWQFVLVVYPHLARAAHSPLVERSVMRSGFVRHAAPAAAAAAAGSG